MNLCFDCEVCPMAHGAGCSSEIFQEIHVTVKSSSPRSIVKFENLCKSRGGKFLTIDMGFGVPRQSMSSVVVRGSNITGVRVAKELANIAISDANVEVERIKVESSIFHDVEEVQGGYYEGHFAIPTYDDKTLRAITAPLGGHTSRNAFKDGVFMVTHRCYKSRDEFMSSMDRLESSIRMVFEPSKRIHEYCHYDTNGALDNEWLKIG